MFIKYDHFLDFILNLWTKKVKKRKIINIKKYNNKLKLNK